MAAAEPKPTEMEIMIKKIDVLMATAPRAFALMNFPAHILSMMVFASCKILAAKSGRANLMM